MNKVAALNKSIIREIILPFCITMGSILAVLSVLNITSLTGTEEILMSLGNAFVNVTIIFTFIIIFDFVGNKSRLLITLNYDRKFIAKYYLVIHVLLIFLISALTYIIARAIPDVIKINGTSIVNSIPFFSYYMISLLLIVNYINVIINTFINYNKLSGFLVLAITLLSIGYILIKHYRAIYEFYQLHQVTFGIIILLLCFLMEIFNYRQILKFEINK